jgi:polyhydroxyalkanoate synthase
MDSPSAPGGPSAYLESLMQAGQQATRQFDDALAAAMGVAGKPAKGDDLSPFAVAAKLNQQFWWPAIDFWRGFFTGKPTEGAAASGKVPRGDRRFKDDAWTIRRSTRCSSNPTCLVPSS